MKKFITSICFLFIAGTTSTTSFAQDAPSGANKQEAKFTSDLLEWALFQVKLLDLARTQAHGNALREFAWDAMPAYLNLGYNIGSYADAHGYTVDPEDGEAEQKVDSKIMKFMGKPKTQEWNSDVAETLRDQNKDGRDMLNDYAKEIKDPQLEQIRSQALATLQSHNDMMEKLKEDMKKPWKNRPDPNMNPKTR